MAFEALVILALVLLNGIFAGAEIALIALRRSRLRELAAGGSRRAAAALALRDEPERFLATVQIGITVVGSAAAAYGGNTFARDLTPVLERLGLGVWSAEAALVLVIVGVSYFSVVAGELVPKSLALHAAEPYALLVSRPLHGLSRAARPLVWLLTASANLCLRLFGDRTTFTEARHSPEELQQFVEDAVAAGSLDRPTSEIASRAFDFGQLAVSMVMVPRVRISALSRSASPEELARFFTSSSHGRHPVHEGGLDHVVGYVVAREALAVLAAGRPLDLGALLHPALFVAETSPAVRVLREMQQRRTPLALVVDEHGHVVGLVTIEDLVEELVGEITSERDESVEPLRQESPGVWLVQGATPVHELNRALDLSLPEGESFDTLAGLCIERRGWIPRAGERVTLEGGIVLEVVEATARRVVSLRLRLPPEDGGSAEPDGPEPAGA